MPQDRPLSSTCASVKECHTSNNRNNNPSSAFSCFRINPMKTNRKAISKHEPISSLSWRRWKVSAATQEMALSKILVKFITKAAGTYSDISEEILADVRSWQTGSGLLPATVLHFRRKTVPPSSARPVWGLGSSSAAYLWRPGLAGI